MHNPAVQDALLDVARFWLDRGVDGFRIDAINFAMHDPQLRDNPPAPQGGKRTRPFDFQQHLHNQSHPDIVEFLERLRALTDRYGERFTVAEVGGDHAPARCSAFTAGDRRLNSAYGFNFLYADKLTPRSSRRVAQGLAGRMPAGRAGPSRTTTRRAPSRAGPATSIATHSRARRCCCCAPARQRSSSIRARSSACRRSTFRSTQLQDPEAIANWPQTLSRDGARTPMPWKSSEPNFGFSTGEPWLPPGDRHGALAVDAQERSSSSLLHFARQCLALRKHVPALRNGSMELVEAGDARLVFDRIGDDRRLRCTFNLSDRLLPFNPKGRELIRAGIVDGSSLGPYAALIEEIV